MWRSIRIHPNMIPRIRYVAAYQVKPISAITHVAEVARIELRKDTQKYALYFKQPAWKIEPIPLVLDGIVSAPQNSRYTSYAKLHAAKILMKCFNKVHFHECFIATRSGHRSKAVFVDTLGPPTGFNPSAVTFCPYFWSRFWLRFSHGVGHDSELASIATHLSHKTTKP
jgi:hypothetical protein